MTKRVLRAGIDAVLGNRLVAGIASSLIGGTRVLGFHGVEDLDSTLEGLDWIRSRFPPVSMSQIVAAVEADAPLPEGVCITFDDGDPSVLDLAEPMAEIGIQAAMFICPGVIDTTNAFWWQIVRLGAKHSLTVDGTRLDTPTLEFKMKSWPDQERRGFIQRARVALIANEIDVDSRQLTKTELLQWTDLGHELGNHTWDHPMLDRCEEDEQERQIRSAHDWFTTERVPLVPAFAYPNGNQTARSMEILDRLGYRCAFLFNHRIATPHESRLEISRIRTNADSRIARLRASVSGLHPRIMSLRKKLA